ncbi:MAG: hypothetical protein CVU78_06035 [Elusimicrobia bacterium HGW-Elusimicrobia-2]|nr:MAG: hypothetical protein CVU78_06035 [Elusimicrobia bacterium HGW-Elusimicrobia-2]
MELTEKRCNSLARVLYDFARVTFTLVVLGQIITPEKFKPLTFASGILSVVSFVFIGLLVEKEE